MQQLIDQTGQGAGAQTGAIVDWDKNLPDRLKGRRTVKLYLGITAVGGTPTLDVDIVKTVNGQLFVIASLPQQTAVGNTVHEIANCPNGVQARGTVGGGSPSVTYFVNGEILE